MRALLFDFNGVLVDDEPIHLELTRKVLAEEGVELADETFETLCLGRDDRAAFTATLTANSTSRVNDPAEPPQEPPPALVERLVARKTAYYHMRMRAEGFPEIPGATDLVVAAADAGMMLGVVTGALRAEVEAALDQMGIHGHFKTVVTADDVQRGKPDPEGYLRGLRELNALPPLPSRLLHPHEVVAIEDTPAGLEAASAAGLTTLGVAHTFPAERLEADRVVPRLGDLDLDGLCALFPHS